MRVVVFGAGGQLGSLVVQQAPAHAKVSAYASSVCDITDEQNIANVISKTGPDLIINCAAYTQVDKAETESARAYAVNEQGVANLVKASSKDTRIIHVSTDFVFDGSAQQPYKTAAATNPLGIYGASKLAGELILQEQAPQRSTIVRTAWLYAAQGQNFLQTMLRLMQTRDELKVVNDQRGTPTAAHELAKALWAFADRPEHKGIYHWTNNGEATWYEFACEIQQQAWDRELLTRLIPISPITTADYPTPAKRPAYSVLEKSATWAALGIQAHSWQQALGEVLEQMQRIARSNVKAAKEKR